MPDLGTLGRSGPIRGKWPSPMITKHNRLLPSQLFSSRFSHRCPSELHAAACDAHPVIIVRTTESIFFLIAGHLRASTRMTRAWASEDGNGAYRVGGAGDSRFTPQSRFCKPILDPVLLGPQFVNVSPNRRLQSRSNLLLVLPTENRDQLLSLKPPTLSSSLESGNEVARCEFYQDVAIVGISFLGRSNPFLLPLARGLKFGLLVWDLWEFVALVQDPRPCTMSWTRIV